MAKRELTQEERRNRTFQIVMTALMMSLIVLATICIKIPIPGTQGYVHLGDAMIFMSVLVLGWKYGAIAAGVGSALADIILGSAMWAPWTLFVKAGMAVIAGAFIAWAVQRAQGRLAIIIQLIGMTLGGLLMVGGYYVAEALMYGNWAAPVIGIPFNIGQFVVGAVLATILSEALCKTTARRYFAYKRIA